jgi:hypothetical protein
MEAVRDARLTHPRPISEHARYTLYALALAVSISTWFLVIRAPLWLDETVSFFLIKGGFAGIMSQQFWPDSPVYSCLLWLWTKAMGTGELTLRISSLLPMLVAVYLLYRAARQLFAWDVAFITAIVFCLHPIIIFAAIDVRPYAFAALALNASILALVHLNGATTPTGWRPSSACWQQAWSSFKCYSQPSCQPCWCVSSPARLPIGKCCGVSSASRFWYLQWRLGRRFRDSEP